VGYQALHSNVGDQDAVADGAGNTAVGYQALYSNNNTTCGNACAAANTTPPAASWRSPTTPRAPVMANISFWKRAGIILVGGIAMAIATTAKRSPISVSRQNGANPEPTKERRRKS
jgi:hypothetical protein